MDRLISEKSVMEVIYGCDWFIDEEHAEIIKERIKSVPSAEPKWIPVSERLPKKDDLYLINFDDGEYELAYFSKDAFSYSGVIAWMSLPKPFEPQESEDKNE